MALIIEVALGVAFGLFLYRWFQRFARRFHHQRNKNKVVISNAELDQLLRDFEAMGAVLTQLVTRQITDSNSFPQDLAKEAARIMARIHETVQLTQALEKRPER